MKIKVAINGFGRIGRNTMKALYESGKNKIIEIVAINDLGNPKINEYLTKYDSVHGKFQADVSIQNDNLKINTDLIKMYSEKNPSQLPWKELGVDIVFECTGLFTSKEKASAHLKAGAKKVLVSAPCSQADATIVYGVNHHILKKEHAIVSNASCTTNCLAPIAKVLNDSIGIESGLMTTIHSYTNDQKLTDVYHEDLYRARSATISMIPTKTGAAIAVGLVIPELDGKLDGMSIRVPTPNVSLVDLSFISKEITTVEQVNQLIQNAANNKLKGILEYSQESLVSVDFNHNNASSSFDSTQTRVNGKLVKVFSWYDNEWGFSNRMLDTALALYKEI